MKTLQYLIAIHLIILVLAGGFIYSGVYPMAADVPHNKFTYWLLETLREQSVLAASRNIEVPDLSDPNYLSMGGPDYNEMCASCHLKPGQANSDLRIGLYPQPLNLSTVDKSAAALDLEQAAQRQFWIIKHGIKASGMPAWGLTHDDQRIWAMVAFIQQLPKLSASHYQILTARDELSPQQHH